MPAVVNTADTIESATLQWDANGISGTRRFIVTGLSGVAAARCGQAMDAIGIVRGSLHPTIAGIQADTISVQPLDSTQAEVTVSYRYLQPQEKPPSPDGKMQIEVGSTVQQIEVSQDITGAPIVASVLPAGWTGSADAQPVKIQVQKPFTTLRLSRKELIDPRVKSMTYTGKTNLNPILGGVAGQWLIVKIEGSSDDGGQSFNVVYELQFNAGGWKAYAIFNNPDTKEPALGTDNKIAITGPYSVYESIDFSGLNIVV